MQRAQLSRWWLFRCDGAEIGYPAFKRHQSTSPTTTEPGPALLARIRDERLRRETECPNAKARSSRRPPPQSRLNHLRAECHSRLIKVANCEGESRQLRISRFRFGDSRLRAYLQLISNYFRPCKGLFDFAGENPHGIRWEKAANSLRASFPYCLRISSPSPKPIERLRDAVNSWRVGQEASHTILDDLSMATHVGSNDRSSTQHRFDHYQRQSLKPGWHH
jgi:hypothetical protein